VNYYGTMLSTAGIEERESDGIKERLDATHEYGNGTHWIPMR
jgi:hypothetical protein